MAVTVPVSISVAVSMTMAVAVTVMMALTGIAVALIDVADRIRGIGQLGNKRVSQANQADDQSDSENHNHENQFGRDDGTAFVAPEFAEQVTGLR